MMDMSTVSQPCLHAELPDLGLADLQQRVLHLFHRHKQFSDLVDSLPHGTKLSGLTLRRVDSKIRAFYRAAERVKLADMVGTSALGEDSLWGKKKGSKAAGEACSKNRECQSGTCKGNAGGLKKGKCTAPDSADTTDSTDTTDGTAAEHEPVPKKAQGEKCKDNEECASGRCKGNLGGVRTGKCAMRVLKNLAAKVKEKMGSISKHVGAVVRTHLLHEAHCDTGMRLAGYGILQKDHGPGMEVHEITVAKSDCQLIASNSDAEDCKLCCIRGVD